MKIENIVRDALDNNQRIIFYYDSTDENILNNLERIFKVLNLQEGKSYQLKNPYSVRLDTNNPWPIQDHLHLFCKGNQFLALNKDGTAHDGYSGSIPKRIYNQLKTMFPNFNIPTDRKIINESVDSDRTLFKHLIDLALRKFTA